MSNRSSKGKEDLMCLPGLLGPKHYCRRAPEAGAGQEESRIAGDRGQCQGGELPPRGQGSDAWQGAVALNIALAKQGC